MAGGRKSWPYFEALLTAVRIDIADDVYPAFDRVFLRGFKEAQGHSFDALAAELVRRCRPVPGGVFRVANLGCGDEGAVSSLESALSGAATVDIRGIDLLPRGGVGVDPRQLDFTERDCELLEGAGGVGACSLIICTQAIETAEVEALINTAANISDLGAVECVALIGGTHPRSRPPTFSVALWLVEEHGWELFRAVHQGAPCWTPLKP